MLFLPPLLLDYRRRRQLAYVNAFAMSAPQGVTAGGKQLSVSSTHKPLQVVLLFDFINKQELIHV
jgi:hypothetical protein